MLSAEALHPKPGENILDLCAAPGGKTTHLVSWMENEGTLVANETHPKRVWELAQNLERWGARNAAITQESPARLTESFTDFFDRVLVDAPCSGEGMFRKSAAARRDWNKNLVESCAFRQFSILKSAVKMLKPGGSLVYSTCTFNPIENESVIGRLLKDQPELEIVERPRFAGSSPGRSDWAILDSQSPDLSRADRIWPHTAPGEGHFVAVLCRKSSSLPRKNHSTRKQYHNRTFGEFLSKPQMRCVLDFWQEKHSLRPFYRPHNQ